MTRLERSALTSARFASAAATRSTMPSNVVVAANQVAGPPVSAVVQPEEQDDPDAESGFAPGTTPSSP